MSSRIIFHLPWKLREEVLSASQIRPRKMMEAFKSLGYEIDIVMGSTLERKVAIAQIYRNIADGVVYDFCYSESSVGPTLITNGYKEFLLHGSPDLKFLRQLRKKNIKVGMFYRDIYWKIKGYLSRNPFLKAIIFRVLYNWDLFCYRRSLDVIFLPSAIMGTYLGNTPFLKIPLPSGCNITEKSVKPQASEKLSLMYVGGIGEHYNLDLLLDVLADYSDEIELLLCVRKNEWTDFLKSRKGSVSENVRVFHKSGEGLKSIYKMADIGSLYMAPEEFRSFAMPYKLFEYIEQDLPILASEDTEAGRFISQNGVGWSIAYTEKALKSWCDSLVQSRSDIKNIASNIDKFKMLNTWTERAKEVSVYLK